MEESKGMLQRFIPDRVSFDYCAPVSILDANELSRKLFFFRTKDHADADRIAA